MHVCTYVVLSYYPEEYFRLRSITETLQYVKLTIHLGPDLQSVVYAEFVATVCFYSAADLALLRQCSRLKGLFCPPKEGEKYKCD